MNVLFLYNVQFNLNARLTLIIRYKYDEARFKYKDDEVRFKYKDDEVMNCRMSIALLLL